MMTALELARVAARVRAARDAAGLFELANRLVKEVAAQRDAMLMLRQRYDSLLAAAQATVAADMDAGPATLQPLTDELDSCGLMPGPGACPIEILAAAPRSPADVAA
ncbi:MAG: hypothetical protein GEV11_18800 [Streptosporangiales bacterium]|nr:hypothetical protein [Streptosporangiales bacterium]